MNPGTTPRYGLPLHLAIPGLFVILGFELLILLGLIEFEIGTQVLLTAALLLLPWIAVLISRADPGSLGYRRENVFLHFGWGMVAGGVWRVMSVLLNYSHLDLRGLTGTSLDLLTSIIWVPFVEETFFRGYIGRSLSQAWGPAAGIFVQAIVFTLLPSHTGQGGWSMISIFVFGLLSGWLMETRRSVWAPWGAHAFANVLPLIVLAIY